VSDTIVVEDGWLNHRGEGNYVTRIRIDSIDAMCDLQGDTPTVRILTFGQHMFDLEGFRVAHLAEIINDGCGVIARAAGE
jgi:hypothetical protein